MSTVEATETAIETASEVEIEKVEEQNEVETAGTEPAAEAATEITAEQIPPEQDTTTLADSPAEEDGEADEASEASEVGKAVGDSSPDPGPSAADLAHRQELAEAEHEYASLGLEILRLADTLKELKKSHTEAAQRISRLLARGPERMPLFDNSQGGGNGEGGGQVSHGDGSSDYAATVAAPSTTATAATQTNNPTLIEPWRTIPLAELSPPLKPPVVARLEEHGLLTIGDLEDLRSQGSGPGVGLRSIKGIGEAKANDIEDAVLAWLSRNRDRAVLAEARAGQAEGQTTVDGDGQPGGEQSAEGECQPGGEPIYCSLLNDFPGYFLSTADSLQSAHDAGTEDLRPKLESEEVWQSGFRAYGLEDPKPTDCPYDAKHGREEVADWMRGWLMARKAEGDIARERM